MDTDLRKTVIKLQHWNIVIFSKGDEIYEKILGYDASNDCFHISAKIISFDISEGLAMTETNGHYELVGKPGPLHPKAQTIFEKLKAHKNLNVELRFKVYVGNGV
jgi:hypothetical protein